jgi:hypothetical protein
MNLVIKIPYLFDSFNGLRYWACGRDADSLDGQKNVRDAENAQKAVPYPQVQCTLCWAFFIAPDSLTEKRYHRQHA